MSYFFLLYFLLFFFFSFLYLSLLTKKETIQSISKLGCTQTLLYYSFCSFRKHSRAREKETYFLFLPPLPPLALAVNKSPAVFTFYHGSLCGSLRTADAFPVRERSDDRKCVCCSQASSKDFDEKIEGL